MTSALKQLPFATLVGSLPEYFRGPGDRFESRSPVALYGALLTLVHFLSGLCWMIDRFELFMTAAEEPVCWPLVPSCGALKIFAPGQARLVLAAYTALALALAFRFALARRVSRPLTAGFIGLWALKLAIMALDYRFRHNVHYMHFFISLAYLIGGETLTLCRWQIVLFYFWAGTLKLNAEWLSGAALYRKPFLVPDGWIPAACFYVVVLELVFVWGLLLGRGSRIRRAVLAQFLLFHAVSWGSVGFFYPMTMFCLLGVFFLAAPEAEPARRAVGYAYCVLFSLLQMVPRIISPDPSLTGEGRLVALHMFDARSDCVGHLKAAGGERVDLIDEGDVVRVRCDPIVVWNRATNVCRRLPGVRFDLFLAAKRRADPQFYKIIEEKNFCARPVEFSIWRKNAWIGYEPIGARVDGRSEPARGRGFLARELTGASR